MPGGRPKTSVVREYRDYPAPTPVPGTGICRIWQGALDADGYGVLVGGVPNNKGVPHRKMRAHRWVWEAVHGPIPPGMVVRHRCDNRPCFRLSHLELGTVAENNADAAKRRHAGPILVLSPSQIADLFDMREAGMPYSQIHPHFPEVSFATVKRIGKLGREQFNDLWGLELPQPPVNPYALWREKGPPK